MYAAGNPRSKKALREMIAAGRRVEVFQPGGLFPATRDGRVAVEGPHYPEPHRWYATVEVTDGVITKVVR